MNPADRSTVDSVRVRPLLETDVAEIRSWPPYQGDYVALDYALRTGGWLDMFPESAATRRFAVTAGSVLTGFTLLTDITESQAEFYIALHPEWLGRGVGRPATLHTLRIAFTELELQRVYLKVRTWHHRGISLYRHAGFQPNGNKIEEVQGQMVRFLVMEATPESVASS